MPDDSSGNYTLSPGYLAVTGQTIQPSQHNPPLEDIASAMTARLSRSGVAPMTGPLKTITGSAGTPAISPNNNPAIGIYWTSTGIAFAGTVAGVRFIGELIPYTLLTAPALTVFPYGQTLLRASFPDLWTVAQADIAAGNTFYNNGNGTTTFGIGDMRGRVPAGKDDMGGTASGRLTTANFGSDPKAIGSAGGGETSTLVTDNLPPYTPAGLIANGAISVNMDPAYKAGTGTADIPPGGGGRLLANGASPTFAVTQAPSTFTGTAQGGTSKPVRTAQPTLIINYVLYAGA
jgi:microcystin-dependent protein